MTSLPQSVSSLPYTAPSEPLLLYGQTQSAPAWLTFPFVSFRRDAPAIPQRNLSFVARQGIISVSPTCHLLRSASHDGTFVYAPTPIVLETTIRDRTSFQEVAPKQIPQVVRVHPNVFFGGRFLSTFVSSNVTEIHICPAEAVPTLRRFGFSPADYVLLAMCNRNETTKLSLDPKECSLAQKQRLLELEHDGWVLFRADLGDNGKWVLTNAGYAFIQNAPLLIRGAKQQLHGKKPVLSFPAKTAG